MTVRRRRLRLAVLTGTLTLACQAAGAQPLGPKPTLHTPDVIAPAVLPYLACLYAERGLPLLGATDGKQVTYDKRGSGCSAARAQAAADAARLLQGKSVPDGLGVAVFVERTLSDMDGYVDSLPKARGFQVHGQSAVIGIPVTIDDEVQPAYARYDECLKTQVSNSLVSANTILPKFREAMATCGSVRALAVSEATRALAGRGWDEATRRRAAETTFANVDESWLVMGQQYRAMLLEKIASQSATAVDPRENRPKD